jgi:PAS domain S-box-containing protein
LSAEQWQIGATALEALPAVGAGRAGAPSFPAKDPLPPMRAVRDFDGYTVSINPSYEATLGWTIEELSAVPFWELLHPADQHRSVEVCQRMLLSRSGRLTGHTARMLCKDGTYRRTSWDLWSRVDEERVYLVAKDGGGPETTGSGPRVMAGSWDWHVRTGLMYWSDRMFEIWGLPSGAAADIAWVLLHVYTDDRRALACALLQSIGSGEPLVVDHRIVRGDGAIRWLHSAGRVFHGADGDPSCLRGLTVDVTDRPVSLIPG